jgi:hypothetical protein
VLQLVEGTSLCVCKELLRHLRRSGIELRPCRGEHTATTASRVRGQLCGPSEERSRCGDAAARLRAPGRTLQVLRDGLVETGDCARPMPCASIRVGLGIGCVGQRAVDLLALGLGRCLVDR